jgi:hypothetical protein
MTVKSILFPLKNVSVLPDGHTFHKKHPISHKPCHKNERKGERLFLP